MSIDAAVQEWRSLLGAQHVLTEAQAQAAYGSDTGGATRHIPAALRPISSAQLPEVMRIAQRHQAPVYPISTGHNWGYGSSLPVQDHCTIIDLSGLRKILHFDAELGVVTVEPGVTQGMLSDYLEQGNHAFMVPTTGAGPSCSLLGNALERGYGITPYADHFGAVTDLEAVLADGSIYRTALRELGGEDLARLFKWGIGPYTAGLFTQSGLGIVTRMSILLARRPECVQAGLFSLRSDALLEPAVAGIRQVLSRLPGVVGGVNLMNRRRVLAMSAPYPLGQVGADGLIPERVLEDLGRKYQTFPWTGFLTLYGTDRVVAAARAEIRSILRGCASRLIFMDRRRATTLSALAKRLPGARARHLSSTLNTLAQSLDLVEGRPNETALSLAYWRSASPAQPGSRNPAHDGCGLIWFAPLVPMRPESVRRYVDKVEMLARAHAVEPLITLTSVGERLFDSTVPILFDRTKQASVMAARACHDALVDECGQLGFYPYRTGADTMHVASARQALQVTVRGRTPADILAPGRYR